MGRRATDRWRDRVLAEAAALVSRGPWDSRRAELLEGESVAVLISSRRRDERSASDVAITILPPPAVKPVTVVLAGPGGRWSAMLDANGRCTIRGVPDAWYRVRLEPG